MKQCLALAAVVAAAFAAGALATSAVTWKPFATGTDSGKYSAYASASGSVQRPGGLAIRATHAGGPIKVNYFYSCNGDVSVRSGKVHVLDIATAPKCTVNAGGIANGGKVKIELLKAR